MTVYIYSLCDPRDGRCRYVGKTLDLRGRLANHVHKHTRDHKSNWIKSLIAAGLKPGMEILETIENSNDLDWQPREVYWIDEMRRRGFELTNLDCGGKSGRRLSDETKAKLSLINTGKKTSPEARRKMSEARKGIPFTPEHAAKIGEANRRRVYSVETCQKISNALRGRIIPDYQKKKISAALTKAWAGGRRWISAETARKISNTLLLRGALSRGYFEYPPSMDCVDECGGGVAFLV